MNVIVAGPQGSGKGTQAELLAKEYGYFHLETGALLREIAKTDKRIFEMIFVKGDLMPDKENFELARDYLLEKNADLNKIVMDGFPRSVDQYNYMKDWLKIKNCNYGKFILINIPEKETILRLTSRRTCKVCKRVYNLKFDPPPTEGKCECGGDLYQRKDDNPKTIKNRLKVYREQTEPVIELAKKDGIFIEVDGVRPIQEIHKDIVKIIGL